MICSQVIKLTLAVAVLALDIVAFLQRMDGHYSTIGLALDCGLLCVFHLNSHLPHVSNRPPLCSERQP
jgi:hypothetical protein